MTFFLGVLAGIFVTIGTTFIVAADKNNLDEGDENYYN